MFRTGTTLLVAILMLLSLSVALVLDDAGKAEAPAAEVTTPPVAEQQQPVVEALPSLPGTDAIVPPVKSARQGTRLYQPPPGSGKSKAAAAARSERGAAAGAGKAQTPLTPTCGKGERYHVELKRCVARYGKTVPSVRAAAPRDAPKR